MAYLYSSSKMWRRIVDATSRSAGYMAAFAAACVAVPYFLGDQVMQSTNKAAAAQEGELEQKLRSRSGIQAQMLAKAQRERLQVRRRRDSRAVLCALLQHAAEERGRPPASCTSFPLHHLPATALPCR